MTLLDWLYVLLGFVGFLGLALMIPQEWIDLLTPDSTEDAISKYYNEQDTLDAEKYGEGSVIRNQFTIK